MRLDRVPQRQLTVHLVAVATANALALDVVARLKVRDDPLHGTLGDSNLLRHVTQSDLPLFRDE